MERGGAQEVEMLHHGPESPDFNIRRCQFSGVYKKTGLGDIGYMPCFVPFQSGFRA